MIEYLQPGKFVDSDHPAVIAYAKQHATGNSERERAVSLYYAIRDGVRYNPFQNFTHDDAYRGSVCLERGEGWCVPKAALLTDGQVKRYDELRGYGAGGAQYPHRKH